MQAKYYVRVNANAPGRQLTLLPFTKGHARKYKIPITTDGIPTEKAALIVASWNAASAAEGKPYRYTLDTSSFGI